MALEAARSRPPVGERDTPAGYEDLTRIDQGGFATVYRARDTRFDRTVAVKILRSDTLGDRQLRRFRSECLATGRVSSHPNIVTVYDAGTTLGHRPWLAMEYCSGGSLAAKIASDGPLAVAEVVSIGARLSSALQAAHDAGILHRDVKPHNVLVTSYGEPALADFGIASVVNADDTGSVATETAAYTVVHAAPEILEGRPGTAASDIYSLGSTLYTLLAGEAPFAKEASTGLAPLVTRILRNDVPAIARAGVPPELERLLRRCMAADPGDRPGSAAELSASLARLGHDLEVAPAPPLAGLGALDPQPGSRAAGALRISPRRALVIIGGALAVLTAGFTAWVPGLPGSGPGQRTPADATSGSAGTAPADGRYMPRNVVVARGPGRGELVVSWSMPIRPDVTATVIYEGPGATRARAIVDYSSHPGAAPAMTLRGLPSGRELCLSVTHLVAVGNQVTSAASRDRCATPS